MIESPLDEGDLYGDQRIYYSERSPTRDVTFIKTADDKRVDINEV